MDATVGDLDRVREGELRLRRDEVLGERARDRHDLEHRSRLEHVGHGVITLQAHALGLREVVRVVTRGLGHREHGPRLRVEHDRRPVLRAIPCDGLPQHLLRVRLDRVVERQVDVRAVALRLRLNRVDRLAGSVLDDPLATGPPGERLVEGELESREPVVVDARVAEHLRRQSALRIEAPFLRVEAEPRKVPQLQLRGQSGVGLARDVHEAVRPVGKLRRDLARIEVHHLRDDRGLTTRIANQPRIRVDRRRLLADCQLDPAPVVDRPARGRDRHLRAVLAGGEAPERAGAHALQPGGAQECDPEQEREDREQQPDPAVGDPRSDYEPGRIRT